MPCIVLIDGDCAMCNATAAWFARRDPAGRLIFAAGQGQTARIAGEPPGGDPGTLVVWQGSRRLVRSTAALTLLRLLGGGWGWLARIDRAEDLKAFDRDGYRFDKAASSETEWIFTRSGN